MKPKTAILAAAALLAAWVAIPSAADDVTDDPRKPTPVMNEPGTPEVVRKQKPGTIVAPKAEQPEVLGDDEMPSAKDGDEMRSAEAGLAKTVRAADSLPRARAKGAANAYGSRVSRSAGLAVDSAVNAKRPRVSVLRKVGGKGAAARSSRRLGQGGSRQLISSRADMNRTSRFARRPAATIKTRRKATLSATAETAARSDTAKNPPPAVRPPLVEAPQQPSATAQAHSSARQTTHALRPAVTTPSQQQQPTRPPRVIEPAPPLDEWEKYVAKTSAMYQFIDAQDAKARSILTDLKHRARQYQLTRGPAFQEAERLQDAGARAARLKNLNEPIDLLFDELKQRLDNLPTIPQKLQAKPHPTQKK
jgi:hypothetical protein